MVLPGSYELLDADNLNENNEKWDNDLLLERDLVKHRNLDEPDEAQVCAELEVCTNVPVLNEGGMVVVAESWDGQGSTSLQEVYCKCTADVVPIIVYTVRDDSLSQQVCNLKLLKLLVFKIIMLPSITFRKELVIF